MSELPKEAGEGEADRQVGQGEQGEKISQLTREAGEGEADLQSMQVD